MQRWILLSLVVVAAAAQKTEDQHPPDPGCEEPLEVGDGTANQKRYYYRAEDGRCSSFQWKGGKKNGNNFESFLTCYYHCHPCLQITKRGGSLNKTVPHYGFSKKEKKCVSYTWPKCNPQGPTFSTLDDCLEQNGKRCDVFCSMKVEVGDVCYGISGAVLEQSRSSISPRYYYSTTLSRCTEFMYNGCGGNENNFLNKADCEKQCSC